MARSAFQPCLVFAVSSWMITIGVLLSQRQLSRSRRVVSWDEQLARFDATHYQHLVETGYAYSPNGRSEVAFFPAFPLAGWVVSRVPGVSPRASLLATANAYLLVAFFVFAAYLRVRFPDRAIGEAGGERESLGVTNRRAATYAQWAFALWPTTFFFRMPYSEALLVLLCVVALYGIERCWPLGLIAVIVGLGTAARPVGVALLLPLAWHTVRRVHGWKPCLLRLAWVLPLSCWGLLAYMTFLQIEFGDALAFAKTQTHWRLRPDVGCAQKALSLASWEPLWAVYVPGSPGYFGGFSDLSKVFGRMRFFNPLFFGGTALLMGVGARKRWLTTNEILLAVPLLAIPYVTRAYEMCMESHGRFAAVVFPVYIVIGHILARLPAPVAWLLLGACGLLLACFSAGYAAGRPFF